MTAPAPVSSPSARLLLGARILLVLCAASSVVAAHALARRREGRSVGRAPAAYVCPMHPAATAAGPGACPICRMALVPAREPMRVADEDVVSPTRLVVSRALAAPAFVDADGAVVARLAADERLAPGDNAAFVPATGGAAVPVSPASQPASEGGAGGWRFAAATPLRAGTTGWIERGPHKQEALVVPYGSLLFSPEGPFVLTVSADGALVRRSVTPGRTFFGFVVVAAGLRAEERVVGPHAVLYETERRAREGRP